MDGRTGDADPRVPAALRCVQRDLDPGREQAASLAELLFALAGSMAARGPLAAGFIYDGAGDYQLAWWLSAGFNALALILLAFARPPAAQAAGLTPPAALA